MLRQRIRSAGVPFPASERFRQQMLQARGLGVLRMEEERPGESGRLRGLPLAWLLATVDRDFNESDYDALLALDDALPCRRGASQELIDTLASFTATEERLASLDDCVVCLEMPELGASMRSLPCSHSFHLECIDKWLRTQAFCPICKRSIHGEA